MLSAVVTFRAFVGPTYTGAVPSVMVGVVKEGSEGGTGAPIELISASVIVGDEGRLIVGSATPAVSTASVRVLLTVMSIVGALGGVNAVAPDFVMSTSTVGTGGNTIALNVGTAASSTTGGTYSGASPNDVIVPSEIDIASIVGGVADCVNEVIDRSDPRLRAGRTGASGAVNDGVEGTSAKSILASIGGAGSTTKAIDV